jgi:malonyl CoA-acyl carrier protein transacylase
MIEVDDIDEWVREHRPKSYLDAMRIAELKDLLASTDYIVVKIAEAETNEEQAELRQRYADVIAQRKQWREQINELEGSE